MGDTGQIHVSVATSDELLSVAELLEHEAAARYRGLAARMARQGDTELAAQFESLARMEDRHAEQIGDKGASLLGHRPDAARAKWETPEGYDEEEARGAELSVYQALAFAVRNEERAFAFYSYVVAEAESAEIRALAEDLARDELQHAAILRQFRRRAFHRKRPEPQFNPADLDELRALSNRLDAEAAAAHAALAQTLAAAGDKTDAALFQNLAQEEAQAAKGAAAKTPPNLKNAADGLRLLEQAFDRYAAIAEHADDEALVAEAQRLASLTVARLARTGGARNNALLQGQGER